MNLSTASHWWQARAPREQAMLRAMAVAIAAFAWWFVLWRPLDAWRDQAIAEGARSDQRAEQARGDAVAIAALRIRAGTMDPRARRAAILESIANAGLPVARQRDLSGAGLQLEFDAVPAPALLAWLQGLRESHGIGPDSMQASRSNGMLQARVVFAATEH